MSNRKSTQRASAGHSARHRNASGVKPEETNSSTVPVPSTVAVSPQPAPVSAGGVDCLLQHGGESEASVGAHDGRAQRDDARAAQIAGTMHRWSVLAVRTRVRGDRSGRRFALGTRVVYPPPKSHAKRANLPNSAQILHGISCTFASGNELARRRSSDRRGVRHDGYPVRLFVARGFWRPAKPHSAHHDIG